MSDHTHAKWFLPVGVRSAIGAEAMRRDSTPSRVVETLLCRYLADFLEAPDEEHETVRALAGRGQRGSRSRPGQTLCGWSVPSEFASALEERAAEEVVEVSLVVTRFFERYLARFIAESVQRIFDQSAGRLLP